MGGSFFFAHRYSGESYFWSSGASTMNLLETVACITSLFEQQCILVPAYLLGILCIGSTFFTPGSPDGHASAPTAASMLCRRCVDETGGFDALHRHVPDARSAHELLDLLILTVSVLCTELSVLTANRLEVHCTPTRQLVTADSCCLPSLMMNRNSQHRCHYCKCSVTD